MLKKVLILDNDPDVLAIMHEALDYEGFEVKTLVETDNILLLINDYKPDILLVDYLLDGINGSEICRQVKNDSVCCNLPIIIFSAYPKAKLPLSEFNCNAFIAKPFDLYQLIDKINELVDLSPNQIHSRYQTPNPS